MGHIIKADQIRDFHIDASLLPERFSITAARRVKGNDYIVIGKENDDTYCSWLYNPDCGFVWGHYQLTLAEALHDLGNRC